MQLSHAVVGMLTCVGRQILVFAVYTITFHDSESGGEKSSMADLHKEGE